jgi:hypothetical protein
MKFIKLNYLLLSILIYLVFSNSIIHSQTWWHTYRDINQIYQKAYDICESSDENYFINGVLHPHYLNSSINIIKVTKYGNILWSKIYTDSSVNLISMACTSSNDGGCIFSGLRSDNKPYATKINSNGEVIWNKTYENHNIYERTVQIIKTSNNNYLLCGLDYLLKIDSSGNYLWSKTDSTILGNYGDLYSVIEAFDGGYICLGNQTLSSYPTVTKLNYNGDIKWQKTYSNNAAFVSLIRKLSNCYLLMGNVPDSVPYPNTNFRYYFSKIDTAGNEMSHHSGFDSTGKIEVFNRGYNIVNDNRFLFTSYDYTNYTNDSVTYTNIKIVDSLGNIVHKRIIEHNHWGYYEIFSALPLNNGYIMFAGTAQLTKYSTDLAIFMARSDTNLYIDPVGISSINTIVSQDFKLYQNYPNPFNPSTNIKYKITKNCYVCLIVYDILGREIITLVNTKKQLGIYDVNICSDNLPSGIYLYSLYIDNKLVNTKRMILLK